MSNRSSPYAALAVGAALLITASMASGTVGAIMLLILFGSGAIYLPLQLLLGIPIARRDPADHASFLPPDGPVASHHTMMNDPRYDSIPGNIYHRPNRHR